MHWRTDYRLDMSMLPVIHSPHTQNGGQSAGLDAQLRLPIGRSSLLLAGPVIPRSIITTRALIAAGSPMTLQEPVFRPEAPVPPQL